MNSHTEWLITARCVFMQTYKLVVLVCSSLKVFKRIHKNSYQNSIDIHTIISKFTEKNNHGPAKSDKSVIFCGGGDGS